MRTSKTHCFRTLLTVCSLLTLFDIRAVADTWMGPRIRETESADGKFIAVVVPTERKRPQPPTLEVFNQNRVSQWRVELSNPVAPLEVLITNDGEYVVTLDNHAQVGYGEEVVAFYTRAGQIKRYSLETIVQDLMGKNGRVDMWELFTHSTSSRWWRTNSISFLDGVGAEARFAIWLPWAQRWYVWKLADGNVEKLNAEATKKWNDIGIRWSRERLNEDNAIMEGGARHDNLYGNQVTACKFMGYLKDPADRKVLEKLLNSEVLRSPADEALARLDGIDTKKWGNRGEGVYKLARVTVKAVLPHKPEDFEGTYHCYIFAEIVKTDAWKDAWPAFDSEFRSSGGHDNIQEFKAPGLKPGRYWVKVIWDRKRRGLFDMTMDDVQRPGEKPKIPVLSPDDFESRPSEIFELRPGQSLELKINCDQPGPKKQ